MAYRYRTRVSPVQGIVSWTTGINLAALLIVLIAMVALVGDLSWYLLIVQADAILLLLKFALFALLMVIGCFVFLILFGVACAHGLFQPGFDACLRLWALISVRLCRWLVLPELVQRFFDAVDFFVTGSNRRWRREYDRWRGEIQYGELRQEELQTHRSRNKFLEQKVSRLQLEKETLYGRVMALERDLARSHREISRYESIGYDSLLKEKSRLYLELQEQRKDQRKLLEEKSALVSKLQELQKDQKSLLEQKLSSDAFVRESKKELESLRDLDAKSCEKIRELEQRAREREAALQDIIDKQKDDIQSLESSVDEENSDWEDQVSEAAPIGPMLVSYFQDLSDHIDAYWEDSASALPDVCAPNDFLITSVKLIQDLIDCALFAISPDTPVWLGEEDSLEDLRNLSYQIYELYLDAVEREFPQSRLDDSALGYFLYAVFKVGWLMFWNNYQADQEIGEQAALINAPGCRFCGLELGTTEVFKPIFDSYL